MISNNNNTTTKLRQPQNDIYDRAENNPTSTSLRKEDQCFLTSNVGLYPTEYSNHCDPEFLHRVVEWICRDGNPTGKRMIMRFTNRGVLFEEHPREYQDHIASSTLYKIKNVKGLWVDPTFRSYIALVIRSSRSSMMVIVLKIFDGSISNIVSSFHAMKRSGGGSRNGQMRTTRSQYKKNSCNSRSSNPAAAGGGHHKSRVSAVNDAKHSGGGGEKTPTVNGDTIYDKNADDNMRFSSLDQLHQDPGRYGRNFDGKSRSKIGDPRNSGVKTHSASKHRLDRGMPNTSMSSSHDRDHSLYRAMRDRQNGHVRRKDSKDDLSEEHLSGSSVPRMNCEKDQQCCLSPRFSNSCNTSARANDQLTDSVPTNADSAETRSDNVNLPFASPSLVRRSTDCNQRIQSVNSSSDTNQRNHTKIGKRNNKNPTSHSNNLKATEKHNLSCTSLDSCRGNDTQNTGSHSASSSRKSDRAQIDATPIITHMDEFRSADFNSQKTVVDQKQTAQKVKESLSTADNKSVPKLAAEQDPSYINDHHSSSLNSLGNHEVNNSGSGPICALMQELHEVREQLEKLKEPEKLSWFESDMEQMKNELRHIRARLDDCVISPRCVVPAVCTSHTRQQPRTLSSSDQQNRAIYKVNRPELSNPKLLNQTMHASASKEDTPSNSLSFRPNDQQVGNTREFTSNFLGVKIGLADYGVEYFPTGAVTEYENVDYLQKKSQYPPSSMNRVRVTGNVYCNNNDYQLATDVHNTANTMSGDQTIPEQANYGEMVQSSIDTHGHVRYLPNNDNKPEHRITPDQIPVTLIQEAINNSHQTIDKDQPSNEKNRNHPPLMSPIFSTQLTNPMFVNDHKLLTNTIANQFNLVPGSAELDALVRDQSSYMFGRKTFANIIWNMGQEEEAILKARSPSPELTKTRSHPMAGQLKRFNMFNNFNSVKPLRSVLKSTMVGRLKNQKIRSVSFALNTS